MQNNSLVPRYVAEFLNAFSKIPYNSSPKSEHNKANTTKKITLTFFLPFWRELLPQRNSFEKSGTDN